MFNIPYEFNFHFYLFIFTVLDSVQHILPTLVIKSYIRTRIYQYIKIWKSDTLIYMNILFIRRSFNDS